ncbi:DEAD/DEAH box helicase family protein [Nocardioides limicola]|uniref:DEAD/DEAH box helicase family protein n=1 Tax=Nocardioides limicola TaxID=2803368 RepID=UPI00193BBE5C|nr:DEAD/DEAH box helicase family protein [Nocardioides sp. DJM-14]
MTPDWGLRFPHPLRRHQREAMEALESAWQSGRRRAWVVLPPGAGKTLVGLESIRRWQRPAVVLSPNAAIQGQWVSGWQEFRDDNGTNPVSVGTTRDLTATVTSVTYQSLAVFTDAREPDEPEPETELGRLHPNGQQFVEQLRNAGPITLVLDECHHLLEVWGRLLAELLEQLPEAVVIGLTATPATTLSTDQAALVDELFGEIAYATSIPAVVREGHLAPFADLVWLTTPTSEEAEWLHDRSVRFAELTTALIAPDFGSLPFLQWLDATFVNGPDFRLVKANRFPQWDAVRRLEYAGLVTLGDDVPVGEEHRQRPTADDWAVLLNQWFRDCLKDSDDPRDAEVIEALRRALPAVGYQLTRNGIRRGRSTVDRVLARSAAKSQALVEIVSTEHRNLGDRLAMLVICDHEAAAATVPVDLRGVMPARAGSARLALASLVADPATAGLAPVMVTGRTVAAAPDTLSRLQKGLGALGEDLEIGPADTDGIAELSGPWRTRQWVPAVTEFFSSGACRVLIGTRALLGEGWNAPAASGLIDLSTARTPGTVVQTRGRTLRVDPTHPEKVAINWTVCCVSEEHPNGDHDWLRTVDKHRGYFGVDVNGDVVDGVAHIHPDFSPFQPPPAHRYGAYNAQMLVKAEKRDLIADAWCVGEPYDDEFRPTVWVSTPRLPALPPGGEEAPAPPALLLTADGLRHLDRPLPGPWRRDAGLGLAGVLALLAVVSGTAAVAGVLVLGVVAAMMLGPLSQRRHNARVLAGLETEPDPLLAAYALADALDEAGLVPGGAAAVDWSIGTDGRLRVRLDGGDAGGQQSSIFAEAFAEMTAPIGHPRYLVPRYVGGSDGAGAGSLRKVRPTGVIWHPVPAVLGGRAEQVRIFERAWQRWLGGGSAVYTRSHGPGWGELRAAQGSNPFDATSVIRLSWQ